MADKRSVIGARLKDARKAMGYSLEYVAAACNIIGEYDCKTRRNADVRAETGLSENAIKQLRAENAFNEHRIQALNALIEFEDGKILQDVYNFLFHIFDGQIEAGNLVINVDDCADMFLLNIIAEFKNLREKIKGGSENGQH